MCLFTRPCIYTRASFCCESLRLALPEQMMNNTWREKRAKCPLARITATVLARADAEQYLARETSEVSACPNHCGCLSQSK
ncbi:hypothetical protein [Enterococcus termitis]|uniref:hypothetical protein n=2 Tax=Enterococcus termitis TaxID=332950 RepID=UPI001B801C43|nr:hypothetical protein [Enterococcus termitis]